MVRQNGQNGSTYTDLKNSVNATNSLVLETEDTNPVLYMSTITSSGINKEMYQRYESGTTYRFIGAYIATTSRDEYSLVDSNKVTKLMGRKEKDSNSGVMKYQYKGDTTYRNLEIYQTVIFVYSNAELTKKANLYSENGITLYASGQSTVNLTNIDILYTTSANDIIPTSVKGEYEKAADYIESIEELQSVKGEYVKTGNVAVDSILNYKLEVIEKQTGCKPQLQIDIPCESMISEADLNIVLGNLLDNAGEALQKSDEKHLDIRLKYEKGILYLSIYNSFDGVVYKGSNSKFKTRKRDDVKHGYGLQSVERVVKKYSGIMRISCSKHLFCVDLFFYV